MPGYILSQVGGATAACGILRAIFGLEGKLGATIPRDGAFQSFVLEIFLTFFLMFVISAVATDNRAVSLTLFINIFSHHFLFIVFSHIFLSKGRNDGWNRNWRNCGSRCLIWGVN